MAPNGNPIHTFSSDCLRTRRAMFAGTQAATIERIVTKGCRRRKSRK